MGPFHPPGSKTHRCQNPPAFPEGLIQSFRELVPMCSGKCSERKAGIGLCPVVTEEQDKKESQQCWERTIACCPDDPKWVSSPWSPAMPSSLEACS
jgi:hypothetical protein